MLGRPTGHETEDHPETCHRSSHVGNPVRVPWRCQDHEAQHWPPIAGAYNLIEGDWDGSLGSGAKGWVVIDSGAPRSVVRTNPQAPTVNPTFMILTNGNPDAETGLKSVDWWGPWRCDPSYSAAGWDR